MQIDISAKSFAGKPVLGPIRLDVLQGERLAILGPSGSGKTSLIDILAGRKNQGVITGDVLLNRVRTTPSQRRRRSNKSKEMWRTSKM